jgi:hypothetical protein
VVDRVNDGLAKRADESGNMLLDLLLVRMGIPKVLSQLAHGLGGGENRHTDIGKDLHQPNTCRGCAQPDQVQSQAGQSAPELSVIWPALRIASNDAMDRLNCTHACDGAQRQLRLPLADVGQHRLHPKCGLQLPELPRGQKAVFRVPLPEDRHAVLVDPIEYRGDKWRIGIW